MRNKNDEKTGKIFWRLLLFAFSIFLFLGATHIPHIEIPEISKRVNAFSLDFLKQVNNRKAIPDNGVLSPQSIYRCLAMSYIASGDKTRDELARVLHFPAKNETLLREMKDFDKQYHASNRHKNITMHIANSLWIDSIYAEYQQTYLNSVQNNFDASLHSVSFQDAENASRKINRWVSDQTNDKISHIVFPSDFESKSKMTRFGELIDEPALAAINAIYFKSDWHFQFDEKDTTKMPFYVDKSKSIKTDMMHQETILRYSENRGFQFLVMPYSENAYSMCVLLPKKKIPVPKIIEKISLNELMDLFMKADSAQVDVLFPKTSIDSEQDVKDVLKSMGVNHAFSRFSADFDDMIHKKREAFRIYISDIRQKSMIDIDEKGSEAASVTVSNHFSIGCSGGALPLQEVQFHADHPFLFMLMHNETMSIVFCGWVSNPGRK